MIVIEDKRIPAVWIVSMVNNCYSIVHLLAIKKLADNFNRLYPNDAAPVMKYVLEREFELNLPYNVQALKTDGKTIPAAYQKEVFSYRLEILKNRIDIKNWKYKVEILSEIRWRFEFASRMIILRQDYLTRKKDFSAECELSTHASLLDFPVTFSTP